MVNSAFSDRPAIGPTGAPRCAAKSTPQKWENFSIGRGPRQLRSLWSIERFMQPRGSARRRAKASRGTPAAPVRRTSEWMDRAGEGGAYVTRDVVTAHVGRRFERQP